MDTEVTILLFSSVVLIVGVYLGQKANHLLNYGRKASAVIFKNNFKSDSKGDGVYYPVVRFLTDNQEWITQELSVGYSPAKAEGTKLEVLYDPEDPTNVQINSTLWLVLLPRLLVIVGVCGIVSGVLEFVGIVDFIKS